MTIKQGCYLLIFRKQVYPLEINFALIIILNNKNKQMINNSLKKIPGNF